MSLEDAVTCSRCGYWWIPRFNRLPIRCARCRSPLWNEPRKYFLKSKPDEWATAKRETSHSGKRR